MTTTAVCPHFELLTINITWQQQYYNTKHPGKFVDASKLQNIPGELLNTKFLRGNLFLNLIIFSFLEKKNNRINLNVEKIHHYMKKGI